MVQTLQASKVSLEYLREKFNLQRSTDRNFFTEWLTELPELTEGEKQALDKIKNNYIYLAERREMLESIVKMVVLSPLLELAGFYQPPFEIDGEPSVQIFVEAEDEIVKGNIDILILQDRVWILAIESKRNALSLELGIPQALVYLLANPNTEKPSFGLVTNGSHSIFLKLSKQGTPQYAISDDFSLLRRQNELYSVLSILKRLGSLVLG